MKKIINIVSILSLVFFSTSCGEKVKESRKIIRPVKAQKVGYASSGSSKVFPGTAETNQVIDLSFRTGGIINRFNVKLGQKVEAGQLLASLDNVQTRLAYEQAEAQKNSAESQLNTARLGFNRARLLFEKGSVSLSDFEGAKNSYRMAEQNFELSKRSVGIQQEQMRYNALYAPKSGLIAAVDVEINENIRPGQRIAVLNVGKSMDILTGIPENTINKVKLGDTVKIDFPALAEMNFQGVVTEIAPSLGLGSGVFPVKAKLLGETGLVKNGMSANVAFEFKQGIKPAKMLIVPPEAVGEDKKGQFVYLLVKDELQTLVKKQHIEIGKLIPEGFEVLSGLMEGQEIVVAGLQSLWDGLEVKAKT